MVNTCCVPKCTSGYKSSKDKEKISLFCFPSSDAMKKKWMKAIPRKNWMLTKTHRVSRGSVGPMRQKNSFSFFTKMLNKIQNIFTL